MSSVQRFRQLVLGLLLAVPLAVTSAPVLAQDAGCQASLGGKNGARLAAQVFDRGPDGALRPVGGRATELQLRSGQLLRLFVRPLDGPARPSGAGCPVKVAVGRLEGVANLLTEEGFIFDGGAAYGQFRMDEERTLDFRVEPFEEWSGVTEEIELENLKIALPESTEFVARLPAAYQPPAGTVCADAVYADAQPAAGVVFGLRVPPDAPPDARSTGADGRVCWEGLDGELLYGELALDPAFAPAVGQSKSRYVSRETSYRLFVVRRPR